MTESMTHCDVVLPAATNLECAELCPSSGHYWLQRAGRGVHNTPAGGGSPGLREGARDRARRSRLMPLDAKPSTLVCITIADVRKSVDGRHSVVGFGRSKVLRVIRCLPGTGAYGS